MWPSDFAHCLETGRSLGEMTTIGIGGPLAFLVAPAHEEELGRLLLDLSREGLDHRVIGGGSNLLGSDEGSSDVVIHPVHLDAFEVEGGCVEVGAGLPLSTLISRAADLGLAGPHLLAGIPGQVGGAVRMNAGGRYAEIAEFVEAVRVRLRGGRSELLSAAEIGFGYRHSEFPEGAVITAVKLKLKASQDRRALKREAGRILKEKNAAQPTRAHSFGCIFKNPEGLSAGRLIERAGCLGLARGQARISPRHGNFIENLGGARSRDVQALLGEVQEAVLGESGVRLELEVCIW